MVARHVCCHFIQQLAPHRKYHALLSLAIFDTVLHTTTMDPISAFSLAVNILTVVDFSMKILSTASEIRNFGDTVTRSDRRLVSEDLLSCCAKLKAARTEEVVLPGDPTIPTTARVVTNDTASSLRGSSNGCESCADDAFKQLLENLADEAMIIAADIQQSLADKQPGASVLKSLRHAVVAKWGEKKLKEKSERLSIIRNELQFYAIISIKANVDLQALKDSSGIKALDDNTQRLIHAISIGSEAMQQELDSSTEVLNQKLEEARWHSNMLHQETKCLAIQHHREQMNAIQNMRDSNQSDCTDKSKHSSTVISKLLNALWFSRMADRSDDINPAHYQTFEWIYSDGQKSNNLSTCTFMGWTSSNNGVFWVSGRAGSGKSTLMKFLSVDDRTMEAFKIWAGDRKLITASYYFWSQAQDPLQKSLHGLLRTLLYDIINCCGDYAELLFPDRFVVDRVWTEFPSSHDLKRAFKRLINIDKPPACVALMIDGLDEFEAPEEEHFELAKTLKDAAKVDHLKLLVSSRPETAFETTFINCQKIRLHELTRADRTVYVTDHLYQHQRFNFLVEQSRDGYFQKQTLVKYIVEESEGIFLWLRLVVAALMEELNTCATLTELQAISYEFPRGLEELYRHMFRRIPQGRRIKGLQLIQLVRCAAADPRRELPYSSRTAPPMSALMLSKAHSDYRDVIKTRLESLNWIEHNDIVQRIDYLLRSHCAGLLELKYRIPKTGATIDAQDEQTRSLLEDPEVAFLHKSVTEFLDRTDIESEILQVAINTGRFEPYTSLMSCLLYKIKVHPISNADWLRESDLIRLAPDLTVRPHQWSLVLRMMQAAAFAEMVDLNATNALLKSLDQTMEQDFREIKMISSNDIPSTAKIFAHWSCYCPWVQVDWRPAGRHHGQTFTNNDSLLSFGIHNGLERFSLNQIGQLEFFENGIKAASLLLFACRATTLQSMMRGGIRPAVILRLLELGADPNCIFEHQCADGTLLSTTPWLEMLRTVRQLRPTSVGGFYQIFEVLRAFIKNKADPDAEICFGISSSCTVQVLVQQFFNPCPDYALIPFVPFEDIWETYGPFRLLPAARYNCLVSVRDKHSKIWDYSFLSPRDMKQIGEWKTILVKLLEGLRVMEQPGRQRRAISILHKLFYRST